MVDPWAGHRQGINHLQKAYEFDQKRKQIADQQRQAQQNYKLNKYNQTESIGLKREANQITREKAEAEADIRKRPIGIFDVEGPSKVLEDLANTYNTDPKASHLEWMNSGSGRGANFKERKSSTGSQSFEEWKKRHDYRRKNPVSSSGGEGDSPYKKWQNSLVDDTRAYYDKKGQSFMDLESPDFIRNGPEDDPDKYRREANALQTKADADYRAIFNNKMPSWFGDEKDAPVKPKKLTKAIAMEYILKHGKDRKKAMKALIDDGYTP